MAHTIGPLKRIGRSRTGSAMASPLLPRPRRARAADVFSGDLAPVADDRTAHPRTALLASLLVSAAARRARAHAGEPVELAHEQTPGLAHLVSRDLRAQRNDRSGRAPIAGAPEVVRVGEEEAHLTRRVESDGLGGVHFFFPFFGAAAFFAFFSARAAASSFLRSTPANLAARKNPPP